MTIYQIVKSLENTSLRNEKLAILTTNKDNETLKRFFFLCLDPFTTFGIKKIPKPRIVSENISLEAGMDHLKKFSDRELTGNAAIDFLSDIMGAMTEEDEDIFVRIVKRKPNCGVSEGLVNEIWPGLVKSYPCLLAEPFTEKLVKKYNWKRARVEKKMDAARANIAIQDNVSVFSRSGLERNVLGAFDAVLTDSTNGFVIDGELIVRDKHGKYLPRSESNGIANKATKGTLSQEEADCLVLVAWDIIPIDDFRNGYCAIPLETRLEILQQKINELHNIGVTKIQMIEGHSVTSLEEVKSYYEKMILEGEEGCMLKDLDDPWEDKRSKKILKFKEEKEAEFEVVGWNDGVDALKGNLGSLNMSSADRIVNFDCSGFPLDLRSKIYANLTGKPVTYQNITLNEVSWTTVNPGDCPIGIGSILTVKYNRKEKNEHGAWSVFLPRFKVYRDDKKVADSFEEIT